AGQAEPSPWNGCILFEGRPGRDVMRPGPSGIVMTHDGRRSPQSKVDHGRAQCSHVKLSVWHDDDVARDIDAAVASFLNCDRLIVDLRGNSGGVIGGLRLMSYLTPGRLPIGYSLSRSRAQKGYRKEELTRFERIPSWKIELLWLVLRYGFIDHSIALFTEGLGPRRFHGRIAMLVNEHSASASKIASEN